MSDGDTILVLEGTYTENVDVTKSVTIIGAGADVTKVQASSPSDHVFDVKVNNITLSGFNITGATGSYKAGIYLNGVNNSLISNNTITNNNIGIYFYSSSTKTPFNNSILNNRIEVVPGARMAFDFYMHAYYNTIENTTVNGEPLYYFLNAKDIVIEGLVLNKSVGYGNVGKINLINCTNITIRDSSFTNNNYANQYGYGVFLLDSKNNKIINADVSNSGYAGFHLKNADNNIFRDGNASLMRRYGGFYIRSGSEDNKIINMTMKYNGWYGINVESGSDSTWIEDNLITHNPGYGILVEGRNTTIINNNIISNGPDYPYPGISIESADNKVINNTIRYNVGGGIWLLESNNTIIGNEILDNGYSGYGNPGIYVSGNNQTIKDNVISGNLDYGIYISYGNSSLIYNNIFNNTQNFDFYHSSSTTPLNFWNTTKEPGTNIINGSYIGGNYWAKPDGMGFSQTCADVDGDGICDSEYTMDSLNTDYLPLTFYNPDDWDHDSILNTADNCPITYNPNQENSDSDSFGNVCDNCPYATNQDQNDTDNDSFGDACDNCPETYNPDQNDTDSDNVGDVCDICPSNYNPDQNDTDNDSFGDACDNCPETYNPDQNDTDYDAIGDLCDVCPYDYDNDGDGDGLCADVDNCPYDYNPGQEDNDSDGLGDTCDLCPGTIPGAIVDPDGCLWCYDSDGGVNETVFGMVNYSYYGNYFTEYDYCSDDSTLVEYYCNPFNYEFPPSGSFLIPCDGICSNGACVSEPVNDTDGDGIPDPDDNCPETYNPDQNDTDSDGFGDVCDMCPAEWGNLSGCPNCTDTDGGFEIFEKGYTLDGREDYCYSSQLPRVLIEYVPNATETTCDYSEFIVNCDLPCENGACMLCYDSDNGNNFTTKGYTMGYEYQEAGGSLWWTFVQREDYCINSTHLVEYNCELTENNTLNPITHECEYGCFDGACRQGQTYVVDWHTFPCTSGIHVNTLSEAVEQAGDGDVILICDDEGYNSYYEKLLINKSITIKSLYGNTKLVHGGIKIESDNVYIQGLTFYDGYYGYLPGGIDADGAILAENVSVLTLDDNTFINTNRAFSAYRLVNSTIKNNIITKGTKPTDERGITLIRSHDNLIYNNTCENQSSCIELYSDFSGDPDHAVYSNIVTKNRIENTKTGIVIIDSAWNNDIIDNEIDAIQTGIFAAGIGGNNIFKYNTITDAVYGISYTYSNGNNRIANNTFVNNTVAIGINAAHDNLNISYNSIITPKANGIRLEYASNDDIVYNTITGSGESGIFFDGEGSYYNNIKHNIVNGQQYFHYVNWNGITLDGMSPLFISDFHAASVSNLGKISLISSNNVKIQNLNLSNNMGGSGLFLYDVSNSTLYNITSEGNTYGITDRKGWNNSYDEIETGENKDGLFFNESAGIAMHMIDSENEYSAIHLENTNDTSLGYMRASHGYTAVNFEHSYRNVFNHVNITNFFTGIEARRSHSNVFKNTNITDVQNGINLLMSGGFTFETTRIMNATQKFVHSNNPDYEGFYNNTFSDLKMGNLNLSVDGYCYGFLSERNPPGDSLEYIRNIGVYVGIEPVCFEPVLGGRLYGHVNLNLSYEGADYSDIIEDSIALYVYDDLDKEWKMPESSWPNNAADTSEKHVSADFDIRYSLKPFALMGATKTIRVVYPTDYMPCISGSSYHTSIVGAKDAASNADSIVICPGQYNESVTINKNLEIMSFSGSPEDTIVRSFGPSYSVFTATGLVNLSGLAIEGAENAYGFASEYMPGNEIKNCIFRYNKNAIGASYLIGSEISGNRFINNTEHDLHVTMYMNSTEIRNNRFYNNTHCSVCVDGVMENTDFINNSISLSRKGLIFSGSGSGNNISENYVFTTLKTEDTTGIYLNSFTESMVSDNYLLYNSRALVLNNSESNVITGNTFNGNTYGAGIYNSDYNEITNNTADPYNRYGILLDYSMHNNVVNNRVDRNVYGISLLESRNNLVEGNSLSSNAGYGIYLDYSASYNDILNNYLEKDNYGVIIYSSDYNDVSGNEILNSTNAGMALLDYSEYNDLTYNKIVGGWNGIWVNGSHHNSIDSNRISETLASGMMFNHSAHNNFRNNSIVSNRGDAIQVKESWNNVILRNTATTSDTGINVYLSSNNEVSENILSENYAGVFVEDSFLNTFKHNYFLSNVNYSALSDNSANLWDDGSKGNYWSDYDSPEEGCYDTNNDDICDSPYNISSIGGDEKDFYPMNMLEIPGISIEMITTPASEGFAGGYVQVLDDKGNAIAAPGMNVSLSDVSEQEVGSLYPLTGTTDESGQLEFGFQFTDIGNATIQAGISDLVTGRAVRTERTIPNIIEYPDILSVVPKYKEYFLIDYDIDNELNVTVSWHPDLDPRYVSVTPPGQESVVRNVNMPEFGRNQYNSSSTYHPFNMKNLPAGPNVFIIKASSEQTDAVKTETLFKMLKPDKRLPRFPVIRAGSGYIPGQNYVNLTKQISIEAYENHVDFVYNEINFTWNRDDDRVSFSTPIIDAYFDFGEKTGSFHYHDGIDITAGYDGSIVSFSYHDGADIDASFNTDNYETSFNYSNSVSVSAKYDDVLEFTYNGVGLSYNLEADVLKFYYDGQEFSAVYEDGEIMFTVPDNLIPDEIIDIKNTVESILSEMQPVLSVTDKIIDFAKMMNSGMSIVEVLRSVYDVIEVIPSFDVPEWIPWVGGHYGVNLNGGSGSSGFYLGEAGNFYSITGEATNSYFGGLTYTFGNAATLNIDAGKTDIFRPRTETLPLDEVNWNLSIDVTDIPLYEWDFEVIKAGVKMDVSVKFAIVEKAEDGSLKFYQATGDIDLWGKLYAGADIVVASVEVTGGANVGMGAELDEDYDFSLTSLRAGVLIRVDWRFLFYSDHWGRKFICDLWNGNCWTEPASKPEHWILIDRDYLGPEYNTLVGALVHSSPTQEYLIVKNTYPDANPQLALDSGDNKMIVYIADNPNKNLTQAFDVYYTFQDESGWSEPEPISNDTTQDFTPDVAFVSDRAIAVWAKINNDSLPENPVNFSEIVKDGEIAYSVYTNGVWHSPMLLTNDSYFDYKPRIVSDNTGGAMVMWMKNRNNEVYVGNNATQDHPLEQDYYYSIWNGSAFNIPQQAFLDLEITDNLEFDYMNGSAIAIWAEDTDGNSTTVADREIYYSEYDGSAWSPGARLTSNNIEDKMPGVLYFNNRAIVSWVESNESEKWDAILYMIYNGTWSEPETIAESYDIQGLKLARNPKNNPVLLWQAQTADGVNIFYSVYDKEHGTWSMINNLTGDSNLEQSFSPVIDSSNMIINTYVRKEIELKNETMTAGNETINVTTTKLVNASIYLLTHKIFADLKISDNDITFSSLPVPGKAVKINANIHNPGDLTLESVIEFSDNGNPIETVTSGIIRGSETKQVSVNWTVPDDGQQHIILVTIDPLNNIAEENETNNAASREALLPDLAHKMIYIDRPEHDRILINTSIINRGYEASASSDARFYYSSSLFGERTLIGTYYPFGGLGVNETETISAEWDICGITAGYYYIYVVLDEENAIEEGDEANNLETFPIKIQPDLEVAGENIVLANNLDSNVMVDVSVRNRACVTAENVSVALFTENPYYLDNDTYILNESKIIANGTIGTLGSNETKTVALTTQLPAGSYYFFAIADYNNTIDETDETNNIAVSPHANYIVSGMTKTGEDAIDADDDGLYDYLQISYGIDVKEEGNYSISGYLYKNGMITSSIGYVNLAAGYQTVNLRFNGIEIMESGENGPYEVRNVNLYKNGKIVNSAENETTATYSYLDFQTRGVEFDSVVSDYGLDTDSDNLYNYLVINVSLNVLKQGNYLVYGSLYDDNRSAIASTYETVSFLPGMQAIELSFNGYDIGNSGRDGNYNLAYLRIYNNESYLVEERTDAYQTGYYTADQFERYFTIDGDINLDCHINIFDLIMVAGKFGKTTWEPGYSEDVDVNSDGKINIFDLVLVARRFGNTC